MAADASDMRHSAFLLLTAAAVAIAAAKTVGAENVYEPSRYKAATQGGYGYEPLLRAIAERYRVAHEAVVSAIGTSMANYLALAATQRV